MIIGGSLKKLFSAFFFDPFLRPFTKKSVRVLGLKTNKHLDNLLSLYKDGHLIPRIDRTYPLKETAEAFKRITEGNAQGKLVISIQ